MPSVEQVELFAGFETNRLAWGYADFGSGTRIAAYACLARLYGEDAEAAKFNSFASD